MCLNEFRVVSDNFCGLIWGLNKFRDLVWGNIKNPIHVVCYTIPKPLRIRAHLAAAMRGKKNFKGASTSTFRILAVRFCRGANKGALLRCRGALRRYNYCVGALKGPYYCVGVHF